MAARLAVKSYAGVNEDSVISELPVNKRDLFGKITLREPVKVGHFSIKKGGPSGPDERRYANDDSELQVLNLPRSLERVHFDLKEGYINLDEGGIAHGSPSGQGLTELLKWILDHLDRFTVAGDKVGPFQLNTDFISYRGTFTKILTLPYERFDDLLIFAQKYKNTIYFDDKPTAAKLAKTKQDGGDERLNMLSYSGFRFEKYIVKPAKNAAKFDGTTYESQHHDELCCMARTRINEHSLLFGAEMDCTVKDLPTKELKIQDFVEIKTTRPCNNQRQYDNFLRKLNRWWAQSYLIGISEMVCGYRDDDLVCRKIEKFNIHDFPKMAGEFWSQAVCLNFMYKYLSFMKECIGGDEDAVYKFYWQPGCSVVCSKTTTAEHAVIPDWYKSELVERSAKM
ncbi:Decapping and exoribonuclease protein [Halotydeus destructor]|nr:Decapping and exoribonuclease protein [Halotydeus destructor]